MPNMSYCRFQNTLQDFKDCVSVLESLGEVLQYRDFERRLHAEYKEYEESGVDDADKAESFDRRFADLRDWEEELDGATDMSPSEIRAAQELLREVMDLEEYADELLEELNRMESL